MSNFIDLTGQRFARLLVIKRQNKDKYGHWKWLCLCDCRKETVVLDSDLKGNRTKSCGCLNIEMIKQRQTKHGHNKRGYRTKTYISWRNMIQRCINLNHPQYDNYGGRSIIICKRWKKFINFLEDMGEVPKGLQIDRKNNDKGYYKSNCRWSTRKEQQRNKRNNRLITFNRKRQCMAAWAEELNININTLYSRINRLKWSIEKALATSVQERRK